MSVADKLSALATAAAEAAAAMRGVPADAVPPPAAPFSPPGLAGPPMSAPAATTEFGARVEDRIAMRAFAHRKGPMPTREQRLQTLMTMDISQLMRMNPGGRIRSDDIADALLARDAEVKEHIRNFQAPGAAEARTAAVEAELERQRAASLVEKAAAARALAEKASLAQRQKEALRQQLEFRQGSHTTPGPLARAAAVDGYERNQRAMHPEFSPERARAVAVALEEVDYRRSWMNAHPDDEDAEAQYRVATELVNYAAEGMTPAQAAAANEERKREYARGLAAFAESAKWTLIGREGETVEVAPGTTVRYGDIEKVVGPEGRITADNNTFGRDPAPGVVKQLYKRTGGRRRKTRRRKTRLHRRSKTSKRA